VSFSVIGASSFPPGDSFGTVTDAARYAPDLPRLHRILLIPNVHFFTFFPDDSIVQSRYSNNYKQAAGVYAARSKRVGSATNAPYRVNTVAT